MNDSPISERDVTEPVEKSEPVDPQDSGTATFRLRARRRRVTFEHITFLADAASLVHFEADKLPVIDLVHCTLQR